MTSFQSDRRFILPNSSSLDVYLLGTVELSASIELQERLRREVAARTDGHGTILVCEHPPSITIGREGSFADVLVDPEELTVRQIEIRWLNRGGGTFVHLPGQLSIYVIIPLERMKIGLGDFRAMLESSLLAAAADLKVPAERATALAGAICRCGQFAFIGAAGQRLDLIRRDAHQRLIGAGTAGRGLMVGPKCTSYIVICPTRETSSDGYRTRKRDPKPCDVARLRGLSPIYGSPALAPVDAKSLRLCLMAIWIRD